MTEQFTKIKLTDITPNPYQPRLHFNPEELKELSVSIKEHGLIQPIIVRKSDIFGYELIAGERRFRAAKLAGLIEIPALIKEISNQESMTQAIIENLQRSNLNPIEEAKAYQQILSQNQMTQEELAQNIGKSRPYISNSIRLLQLTKPLQEALEFEQLSAGHARLLVGLAAEEQEMYLEQIKAQNLSVRQLEQLLQGKTKTKKTQKKVKDLFLNDYELEISRSLGLPVKILIEGKKDTGHITLSFSSEEEFQKLINKLK
ncbi:MULTISPECIES: ParB/RepB/Spo0J family partition protein [unclassified Streptococcus]|uniref:ParB/RepB/Spo0J family partition protein n=1 Tax=unclassified Streptococcus TaxID=2608887 RepID=UPI0011B62A8F|nr:MULTISPECIES: ParB/RepB/Spo0J family partition protein [unclassified Streptococcus]TWS94531.1 ParB/RepB/Spo0J family partition protein [Streptococcus sp. sy018]TWT14379.1 ParB/RepB/Spo0J family partition protein [Streptococcus sp. sy010]